MNNLKGKRILIIGSDNSDMEIVKAAKEHGIYTVVADGTQKSLSTLAKNMADESWDIDYSDTAALVRKARTAKIDGVLAGYSETRVLAAMRIANELGMPFYTNEEVFNITRNKKLFKEACVKYGVKVPEFFCIDRLPQEKDIENIHFPVVVKPIDSGGRKGLTVCSNSNQLMAAIDNGLRQSQSHEIIVEEYLNGVEFTALYTIADGIPSLSIIKDKYLVESLKSSCISNFSIAPSRAIDRFVEQAHPAICSLLTGIGAQNGIAAVQGIYNHSGFFVFETNYRIGDGNDHRIISRENGTNYMDMMLHYSLTGIPGISLKNDNPHFMHYCSRLQVHIKPGTIKRMEYPTEVDCPQIASVIQHKIPGMVVRDEVNTGRRALSIFIICDTIDQVCQTVDWIQSRIVIESTEGEDMTYPSFDTAKIKEI